MSLPIGNPAGDDYLVLSGGSVSPLAACAASCARHAGLTAALAGLAALLSLWLVATRLGMDTDTSHLFAASLPWQRVQAQLHAAFPQNDDLVVAVIDAATPEQADATAGGLAAALAGDPHVRSVRRPDAAPYLERNGLLFLDRDALARLLDQTVDAQPFLGELAADPTLRGLAGALSLLAQGVLHAQADLSPFAPALARFHAAFASALSDPHPAPLSWQMLLAGDLASMGGPYRFVLVEPRLALGTAQPGASATRAVHDAASRLEFVRDGSARVRITGSVAMDDEEFVAMARGALVGLGTCLLLVTVWLFMALGSWRLIVPVVATLLLGLVVTTGFAAVAVGSLNLVSVAFAVLFVGLPVDFAIQFAMSVREARCRIPDLTLAVASAARRSGGQIVIAALASAAGFLAFTPVDFRGVAQLGLIAGAGMLLALVCTLTVLPALLVLLRAPMECGEIGFPWARRLDLLVVRHRRLVLGAACLVGGAGVVLVPLVPFDSDPLHTRNQRTEAVRTLADLAADPITNPYTIDVLAQSAADARVLAARLAKLPTVDSTLTLDSLVPEDQGPKLRLVGDAAALLLPTLAAPPPATPATPGALRVAVAKASALIDEAVRAGALGRPLVPIEGDLHRLAAAPDATLLRASRALTRFLPEQLDMLRSALGSVGAVRADVPPVLARDWVSADGRARISVLPKPAISRSNAGLHRFVREVTGVVPDASGSAVTIVRSADTMVSSFRAACVAALGGIALVLLVALRRLFDVALVVAPLVLSALLTVVLVVVLPLPLNFANIIALPLLMGIGVAFNVYFVMGWRSGLVHPLASPTARAVLFSALTTASAFAALSVSDHPGMASLGALLLVSLACTVVSTLLFLPALLTLKRAVNL